MRAAIVGSSFSEGWPGAPEPEEVEAGVFVSRPAEGQVVVYRHGVPHQMLPHQVPYRRMARWLKAEGCEALLVTSSVGVMDADIPLYRPLVVDDLLMPSNQLPDGSVCTVFEEPDANQGHLVLQEGLFSKTLSEQIDAKGDLPRVGFAYVPGPRTKTSLENRYVASLGAQVNSMSLGPEVVLANELEIPTAAVVVGHKYSGVADPRALDETSVAQSLVEARGALIKVVETFLQNDSKVPFGNYIHRFDSR